MTAGVVSPPRSRRRRSPPDVVPPPLGDGRGGGGSDWVRLLVAANDIEAHLLVGRLEVAGIDTQTIKDRSGPGAWLLGGSDPWAPVEIRVRRRQLDDARIVLAELALEITDPVPDRPIAVRRLPVVWWLTALALGILFSFLALDQMASSRTACQVPAFCDNDQGR